MISKFSMMEVEATDGFKTMFKFMRPDGRGALVSFDSGASWIPANKVDAAFGEFKDQMPFAFSELDPSTNIEDQS